uniref:Uncharacterized protein n=1 Tax=Aegilops tauschii TaxID=37682 RepID=M8CP58_AEGTA
MDPAIKTYLDSLKHSLDANTAARERWGQDHVCPTSVQLHVVEELLDLFGLDNTIDP